MPPVTALRHGAQASVLAAISPIARIPLPLGICRAFPDVAVACPNLGGVIGTGTAWAAEQVMSGVTAWFAHFATWLLGRLVTVMSVSTTPTLSAPWFLGHYRVMSALAGTLVLPLLLVSLVQALIRLDWGQMARSVFALLPLALLLTAVAIVVVQMLLGVTDELCRAVSAGTAVDVTTLFARIGRALGATGGGPDGGVPLLGTFICAVILVLGGLTLWIELLLRTAAIYVAVLFLPILLATLVWPVAARWCRVLVEALVALIFAKFVIVAVVSLAAAGLAQASWTTTSRGC